MRQIGILAGMLMAVGVVGAAEIRYADVLYLDDWKMPALTLKVLRRVPITFSRDQSSVIAYLPKGQSVGVLGFGETRYYADAQIVTGPARGWVDADALESPPEQLLKDLREKRERALAHRELIERHEVALGMTREEVHASLGRPDRKSRVRSAQGEEEQWVYIAYRYLPFYTQFYDSKGELRPLMSYRRVPSGRKVVVFRGGDVVAVTDEVEEKPPPEMLVVPPALPGVP